MISPPYTETTVGCGPWPYRLASGINNAQNRPPDSSSNSCDPSTSFSTSSSTSSSITSCLSHRSPNSFSFFFSFRSSLVRGILCQHATRNTHTERERGIKKHTQEHKSRERRTWESRKRKWEGWKGEERERREKGKEKRNEEERDNST